MKNTLELLRVHQVATQYKYILKMNKFFYMPEKKLENKMRRMSDLFESS